MPLFSAEETAARLQNPEDDKTFTLAHMNVENFHFAPRIADNAPPPLVTTGIQGCGIPLCGMLCFDEEDHFHIINSGRTAIIATDFRDLPYFIPQRSTHGMIALYLDAEGRETPAGDHDIIEGQKHTSMLFDNPEKPTIILDSKNKGLILSNGTIIKTHDRVTIEPSMGHIWKGHIDVTLPPTATPFLEQYFINSLEQSQQTAIGLSVFDSRKTAFNYHLKKQLNENTTFGLWRSERALVHYMNDRRGYATHLTDVIARFPQSKIGSWEHGQLAEVPERTNYRLIDLTRLPELLPDHTLAQIKKLQETLHPYQIRNALCTLAILNRYTSRPKHQTIVVPNVDDGKQALKMRHYIEQAAATQDASDYIHVGFMIETPEALANIADIVPHASSLCIGSNDLVARLLQTSREVLMRTEPYTSFMSPKVQVPLRRALQTALRLKPNLQINFCGAHTDGTYIPATDAALSMGATMLTIPPHMNNVLRTQAAILRFHTRQKLGMAVP